MPVDSATTILTLSNTHAKQLAGSHLTIGHESYSFKDYDPLSPGQPPWRSGAEGKAYPLLGPQGSVAGYLKFFARPTRKRLERTAWLIGQQIHAWMPSLVAAPLLWADTRQTRRRAEIDFDFAGYLARAVPGRTWLEIKNSINETHLLISEELRWHCVRDLLGSLAAIEQAEIAHGDMSPNNIVIDLDAPADRPALYLIDFDAFVAPPAGACQVLNVAEGGTYGTDGYCPPVVSAKALAGDISAAPCSDRYGRDMLLLELLLMDRGAPLDDPPALWDPGELERRLAIWRASTDPASRQILRHLEPPGVFSLPEQQRPTSMELARGFGLPLPPKPVLRPMTEIWRFTPAIPGHKPAPAQVRHILRRPVPLAPAPPARELTPALLNALQINPRRWYRQRTRPLWKEIVTAVLCFLPILLLLVLGLLSLLLTKSP